MAISSAVSAALGISIIVPTKYSIVSFLSLNTFPIVSLIIVSCIFISCRVPVRGTIISGIALIPFDLRFNAASIIALACISVISGYVLPNLHPLCPSMGLNSCRASTLAFISSTVIPISAAISFWFSSSCGTNSCKGGSSKRTVTGKSCIASKIPSKSSLWIGNNFFSASRLPASSSASIISRMALIRLPSKNMCSVLVSPIPTAPKSLAIFASFGVSALVLTFIVAYLPARSIILPKSPLSSGSTVAIIPL